MNTLRQYIQHILAETSVKAYHGTIARFSTFDPDKTTEFGIHFSLTIDTAQHRSPTKILCVKLTYNKPIHMPDLMRWNLINIMREIGAPKDKVIAMRKDASARARKDGQSMRVHENRIVAEHLDSLGYDAIIYDNLGEAGGQAVIVWNTDQIDLLGEV